jgi:hypothetical protein
VTLLDDQPTRSDPLPVLHRPAADDRRQPYEPKHVLETPRRDTTTMWLFLVLILTSGFVAGTTAAFRASATDTGNVFGSATLSNPAGQTVALAGNDLNLTISALGGFDGSPAVTYGSRWRFMWPTGVSTTGSSYGCSASTAAYTADLADSANSVKTVDYTTVAGFADGRWMCVMAHTAYPATRPAAPAQQWYSQKDNPSASVQLGHVVQSVSLQDVQGTTSSMKQTDRLVITFNQPVDATTRPTSGYVCARSNPVNRIFVAPVNADGTDLSNCINNNPPGVRMFYLEGANATISSQGNFTSTTWTWSGDGRTLTITLGTNATSNISCASAPCFRVRMDKTQNPSTALESATGGRALCVATDDLDFDNGICEPYTVGSF